MLDSLVQQRVGGCGWLACGWGCPGPLLAAAECPAATAPLSLPCESR